MITQYDFIMILAVTEADEAARNFPAYTRTKIVLD
jgi:hypothetical protein